MKKLIFIFTLPFMIIHSLHAESQHLGTGAHGGDGLICFKHLSSKITVEKILKQNAKSEYKNDPFAKKNILKDIEDVFLLDLYLAQLNIDYQLSDPQTDDEEEMIQIYLNKMRQKTSFFVNVKESREKLDRGGWRSNPAGVNESLTLNI